MFFSDDDNEAVESIVYEEDYEDTSLENISKEVLSESESESEPESGPV